MDTSAVLHFVLADIAVRELYRYAIVMNPIAKYNGVGVKSIIDDVIRIVPHYVLPQSC